MNPYYLKFADEAQAIEVLADYRTNDGWVYASLTHALDTVGTIFTGGTYDDEGNELKVPTVLEGYHVNMMLDDLPDAFMAYAITPTSPSRVFAGT